MYEKLRQEGRLSIEIPGRLLPYHLVGTHLAEVVTGSGRSHYIGTAGNGGLVIYLGPP